MTNQTKHFIDLSDILALRLVCKYCDASLSVPLSDEKLKTENMKRMFLSECPSCGRNWAEAGGSSNEPLITRFTSALNRLRDTFEAASHIGMTLVLEIKSEAAPDQGKRIAGKGLTE